MNQEIKAKWVAALRSGKYPQGKRYLNSDGKLCCLGVLCEIAVEEGVAVRQIRDDSAHIYYDGVSALLPESVVRWADLPDESPEAGEDVLTALNDNGKPFTEIADIIESKL